MGKQVIGMAMVRRKVREVCNLQPGHGKTEKMLLEFVNDLCGGGVDVQMLREAIEWNLGQGFIRYEDDAESEERLWFITAAGIAKEKIK